MTELKTHQELGHELELFMTHELSSGSVFLLPNGVKIWRALEEYFRAEYKKRGYKEVITPIVANYKLFKQSGHIDNYQENMFGVVPCHNLDVDENNITNEEEINQNKESNNMFDMYLCPTNCAKHCLIYCNQLRSYKELPLRIADFCCLHRNESSGSLRGLNRLKKFSQDDAHIFCTEDQIQSEIVSCMQFLKDTYALFGLKYRIALSTRPDKFMGNIEAWIEAEEKLIATMELLNLPYTIKDKDGAFYGPKIDIMIEDALGREVQCGTIQLDFQLPHNFNLEYKDNFGAFSRPVMIHRAICGSIERMMSILIEHFQGKFPLWLSPRQVAIVPVSHKPEFIKYCDKIKQNLESIDPRLDSIHVFDSHETMNYKLREAETKLYNYVLVVGKKEIESNTITYRIINHKRNDQLLVPIEQVFNDIKNSHYNPNTIN